jgi:Flp pilus assembly protein TadB
MSHDKEIKIYEYISYALLIGATVVFLLLRKSNPTLSNTLTLLILVVAMFMRMLMERARRKTYEEENESLKADLKHLTSLLRKEKNGQ